MDYAGLFDDEPTAEERARVLALALGGRENLGMLAVGGQNDLLKAPGAALLRSVDEGRGVLASASQARAGARLRRGLEREQQTFQAGEAEKGRAFQARQGALNRALSREKADAAAHKPPHGAAVSESIEHQETEKDVENYGKRTEGSASVLNDLRALEAAAAQPDIPGVSKGYRFVPDVMEGLLLDEDELSTRQAARGMVGNLLKMRSGTAASDAEVARVMAELGMGPNASEEEFRVGLKRLTQNYRDEVGQKFRTMRPEAQRRARERGLLTAEDFAAAPPAEGAPGAQAQPRQEVRRQVNRTLGKTRVTYSDGTVEELDGIR